jgi:hypothetical protein
MISRPQQTDGALRFVRSHLTRYLKREVTAS